MSRNRKSKRESLEPDLTPLIDVAFLLLIFFMVSSVFKKEDLSLLLTLPKAAQGKGGESKAKAVTIEVSSKEIAFNGVKVEFDQLDKKCSKLSSETVINLRVDGKVTYDRVVKTLDLLQKNKLENVSLITEKE